jgi:hypothetical protein
MRFACLIPVPAVHILPSDSKIYKYISNVYTPFPMLPPFWLKEVVDVTYVVTLMLCLSTWIQASFLYRSVSTLDFIVSSMLFVIIRVYNCCTDGSRGYTVAQLVEAPRYKP